MFARAPDDFDLLVTDYAMPVATGIDLAARLRQRRRTCLGCFARALRTPTASRERVNGARAPC